MHKSYHMKDTTLLNNDFEDDMEDHLYERQALIDDQELCNDEINLMSSSPINIRQRQSAYKTNKSISNLDDGTSHFELRNINNNINKTRDLISEQFNEFTYYDIQPNDSLQSICLRFACSVNQVKRLNGLMTDQEFYALKRIKLPLGKLALLEDILKQRNDSPDGRDLLLADDKRVSARRPRMVNSPGSALFVSTRTSSNFEPLMSPGFSSDKIDELTKGPKENHKNGYPIGGSAITSQLNHSHSFSSLRDLANNDININIEQHYISKKLKQDSFIKSELSHEVDLLTDELSSDHVDKVFEDLDYHVERAKIAAESYDQRAADLVERIETNEISIETSFRTTSVSKIPDLFFCNEGFGLNYKKLVIFIFIVCVVVPLVYVNQAYIVTSEIK